MVLRNKEIKRKSAKSKAKYDGGISAIVTYYKNKYQLTLPNQGQRVQGNKFHQISLGLYQDLDQTPQKVDHDIFASGYLKMYYLKGQKAPFAAHWDNFLDSYVKKEKDSGESLLWVKNIGEMLLIFIAFKNNYKLGFDRKKYGTVKRKFNKILKDFVENYMADPKVNDRDLFVTWALIVYNQQSQEAKSLGQKMTLKLLQTQMTVKTKGGDIWWDIKEDQNYLKSWLAYGIMRDHLDSNSKKFIETYSMETIKKQNNVLDLEEGFESRLERAAKKKKLQSKSTSDYPFWKILLAWIVFPILIYVSIRLFLYMTSKLFSLKMINE